MRTFETGATRDTDAGKPDYFGFESALVRKRFGEYMLKHQVQADGQVRSSSNWKSGMPPLEYVRSLVRHVLDVELAYEGYAQAAREPVEEALCAILFNAQGCLLEVLKERGYGGCAG